MSHSEKCLSANRFGDGFDCVCEKPKRTPAYTYSVAYTCTGHVAVTVVDGDRHVVTAYAEGEIAAGLLGRELVAALTEEIARVRGLT